MNNYIRLIVPVLATLAAACGTTSELQQPATPEAVGATTPAPSRGRPRAENQATCRSIRIRQGRGARFHRWHRHKQAEAGAGADPQHHNGEQPSHVLRSRCSEDFGDRSLFGGGARTCPGKALVVSGKVTRLVEGMGPCVSWSNSGRQLVFRRHGATIRCRERQCHSQCLDRQQQLGAWQRTGSDANGAELHGSVRDQDRGAAPRRQEGAGGGQGQLKDKNMNDTTGCAAAQPETLWTRRSSWASNGSVCSGSSFSKNLDPEFLCLRELSGLS